MNSEERQVIEDLFRKLAEVGHRSGLREPEAEALIERRMAELPGAAYYMLQTIHVQEQALVAAEERLREIERRPSASGRGGFLSGLFSEPPRASPRQPQAAGRWGVPRSGHSPGGFATGGYGRGGFLAGAAQTAMGVAGGVVLGNFLADMLSPDAAQAAETDAFADSEDQSFEDGGGYDQDAGGDFGGDA